jgi:hypothetical protein
MVRHRPLVSGLFALTLVTALAGCSTMRPIERINAETAPGLFSKIEIGDRVAVKLTDGSTHRFTVREIEAEAVVSDSGRRYPRVDIASVRREARGARKAAGVAKAIAGGYAVLMRILTFGN